MKKFLFVLFLCSFAGISAYSADVKWKRVEASELNLCGKAFDTPNPYHRVDTEVDKGFVGHEIEQCHVPAGLTVLFRTDASRIGVSIKFGEYVRKSSWCAYRGFDLYFKVDGKWKWAGSTTFDFFDNSPGKVKDIVANMDDSVKECLLFFPIYAELDSCQICVPEDSEITPMDSPFRHRIVFHGSSFTQGVSLSRSGMGYASQFMRNTGMQVINLGYGGNCKMQSYFADLLGKIDADAFVLDPFSNPDIPMIRERLEPFIDQLVREHPGKPIIVQRTIYWEKENFDRAAQAEYGGRRALTDSLMPILCKRYKDVYYIRPDAAIHNGQSSTADGIHPNDNGYSIWEASIEKPILRILRKYGIR